MKHICHRQVDVRGPVEAADGRPPQADAVALVQDCSACLANELRQRDGLRQGAGAAD
jgi:hypothetical protein